MSQANVGKNNDLQRLIQLGRSKPEHLARFIGELARAKEVQRFLLIADELADHFIGTAAIQQSIGEAFAVAGHRAKATNYAERAAKSEPDNPRYLINYSLNLLGASKNAIARRVIEDVSVDTIREPKMLSGLASVHFHLRDYEQAAKCYEKAIRLEPKNSSLCFSLAAIKRFLGELDQAEAMFDRALVLNPKEFEAYYIRSGLRTQTLSRNHIAEMESILNSGLESAKGEIFVSFALAKEYEDIEEYENSFHYLKRGSDLRRRQLNYNVSVDEAIIEEIIRQFTFDSIAKASPGFKNSEPIFLVGLPRTGTTLLERMLSSHPNVIAAGELPNFSRQMMRLISADCHRKNLSAIEQVRYSLKLDMSSLGASYLESTRDVTGTSQRFVDKLPFNYLNIGLIAAALPDAKILHMTRYPMDSCFAIYKTLFQRAYPFSYDLDELAKYYVAYYRLMAHWHSSLPGKILDVAYEDLVADPETELRRVFAHCDLDWEPQAVEFHKNKEASTTASASQIRQPVHQKSVGRWRRYEKQLAGLQSILEHAGIPNG